MSSEGGSDGVMISFGEDDDDVDEFADLFSFATAPEFQSRNESTGKGAEYSSNNNKIAGVDSFLPSLSSSAVSMVLVGTSPADGTESQTSEDSFLELLEQHKDPISIVTTTQSPDKSKTNDLKNSTSTTDQSDTEELNLQEVLDWLEADDDDNDVEEGEIVFIPPPQPLKIVDRSKPSTPPPTPPPTPEFETLQEAVSSPQSTLVQIRELLQDEGFLVQSSVRPQLWCRMVCGKTMEEILKSSFADSFQNWEQKQQQQHQHHDLEQLERDTQPNQLSSESSNEQDSSLSSSLSEAKQPAKTGRILALSAEITSKYREAQKNWLHQQSAILSHRINAVRPSDPITTTTQQNMTSILMNYLETGGPQPTDFDDDDESQTNSSVVRDEQDVLLPPVVCGILSAGVPKPAAAYMLSQIIPKYMPILALTMKERQKAAFVLHEQFYFLACYHIPLLVFHLDRYFPDWYQARPTGFLPRSFLISHFAGDCSSVTHESDDARDNTQGGFFLDQQFFLSLWDLLLTSSNTSLRFFLVLAALEAHAHELVLLTNSDLRDELTKVLSFQLENVASEGPMSLQQATKKIQEWSDHAQSLWEQTPLSVVRRLRTLEDEAVTEALGKRQLAREERLKRKVEAEQRALQEAMEAERERKADEARLRLTRARLVAFYRQQNPGKETNIDKIMETYAGRYDILDAKLKQKYGVGFNPAVRTKAAAVKPTPPSNVSNNNKPKENAAENLKRDESHLVYKVEPSEVLTAMCWSKQANQLQLYRLKKCNKLEESRDGRLPLKYFLVDSRPSKTAQDQGRFPTSLSLPPDDLTDADRIREQEDVFESLRGAVHIVIIGEGFAALPNLYGHKMTNALAECIKEDDLRNNSCALFFLKKGYPFISILDGGFAAAHAFLCREGKNHHLRVQDVLADYDPEISIFGQFERVHNSTGREKAQRALQSIFDSSLVALTKNTRRFESLASDIGSSSGGDDRQKTKGGSGYMVARFFTTSGGGNDEGKKEESEDKKDIETEGAINQGLSGSSPGFRNLFARKRASGDNSDDILEVEIVDDLDLSSSATGVDEGLPSNTPTSATTKAITNTESKVVTQTSEKAAAAESSSESNLTAGQTQAQAQAKANPFSGFGAALNSSLKAASMVAASASVSDVTKGRGINPFARFQVGSSGGGKPVGTTSQHEKPLGSSQHGKSSGSSQPTSGLGMARNFAGLGQFRRTTMARMPPTKDGVSTDKAQGAEAELNVDEEAVPFDKSSSAIASSGRPRFNNNS